MNVDGGGNPLPATLRSIRRWILGLGAAGLAILALAGAPGRILAGFFLGAALALWSLDDLATAAVAQLGAGAGGAVPVARGRFVRRWLAIALVLVVGHRLGAEPVAAAAGILLLQGAMVCRSIAALAGLGQGEPGIGGTEGT